MCAGHMTNGKGSAILTSHATPDTILAIENGVERNE